MDKLAIDMLDKARGRVASGWCQEDWARDKKGNSLAREQLGQKQVREVICQWCLAGALYESYREKVSRLSEVCAEDRDYDRILILDAWKQALRAMMEQTRSFELCPIRHERSCEYEESLIAWNDDAQTSQEHVLEAFDQAIIKGKAQNLSKESLA